MENTIRKIDVFEEIKNMTNDFMSEVRYLSKDKLSPNKSYRLFSPIPLSNRDSVYFVGFEIDSEDEDGDLYVYCERLDYCMETLEVEDGAMSFEMDIYELARLIVRIQNGDYSETITYNN
jgi:hypothetical protein